MIVRANADGVSLDVIVEFCQRFGGWRTIAGLESVMAKSVRSGILMTAAAADAEAKKPGCACRGGR